MQQYILSGLRGTATVCCCCTYRLAIFCGSPAGGCGTPLFRRGGVIQQPRGPFADRDGVVDVILDSRVVRAWWAQARLMGVPAFACASRVRPMRWTPGLRHRRAGRVAVTWMCRPRAATSVGDQDIQVPRWNFFQDLHPLLLLARRRSAEPTRWPSSLQPGVNVFARRAWCWRRRWLSRPSSSIRRAAASVSLRQKSLPDRYAGHLFLSSTGTCSGCSGAAPSYPSRGESGGDRGCMSSDVLVSGGMRPGTTDVAGRSPRSTMRSGFGPATRPGGCRGSMTWT